MSLESIIEHILDKANAEREKIIQQANDERNVILRQAKEEAETLYQTNFKKERALYEKEKERIVVNARLESKKDLLKAKQELIDSIFEKLKTDIEGSALLKKQRITRDKVQEVKAEAGFYIDKFRFDYESEVAKILFG